MKPWQASLDKAPSKKSKGGKEEQREKKKDLTKSEQAWSLCQQNPKWIDHKGVKKNNNKLCSRSPSPVVVIKKHIKKGKEGNVKVKKKSAVYMHGTIL
jgi:hypothetical protein